MDEIHVSNRTLIKGRGKGVISYAEGKQNTVGNVLS